MSTQTRGRDLSRAPVTLDDLTADLIWPRLLRAASLALAPSRLGIAFFLVIALMLIGEVSDAIGARTPSDAADSAVVNSPGVLLTDAINGLLNAVAQLRDDGVASALYNAFIAAPAAALTGFPVATIVAAGLGLLAMAIAGGAISRMAACEFSLGLSVSWPQGLGFAIGRLGSIVGALLGPVVVVWVLALLIALGGLMLRVPYLNVVGGLLFGVALVLGLVAVLVMIAFTLGKPMLIPAVACDGADAIDAIQRAYAYVFGRPLRLAVFIVVLLLELAAVLFLVRVVAWGVELFTGGAVQAMAGESGRDVLRGVGAPETEAAEELGAGGLAAAWLIRLWLYVLWALVWAYALSFYFCASTLLYLAMRRVTDGQDMHELWLPGMVSGTTAEESSSRAAPVESASGGFVE